MAYVFQPARYELLRQIRRYASAVRGKVLDVGSGPHGRYKGLFKYEQYVRLDVKGTPNVELVGTADAIPAPDGSFDSIISTQVLGDVYDLPKAFSEFFRVLRPGGAAVITEALFDSIHDEPHDYWRFTEFSLRELAEDAGFEVEALEARGGLWSVRAQMLIRYWINRLDVYHRWYCPIFSVLSRIYCVPYLLLDRLDRSKASRIFTHGYILVARKPGSPKA